MVIMLAKMKTYHWSSKTESRGYVFLDFFWKRAICCVDIPQRSGILSLRTLDK